MGNVKRIIHKDPVDVLTAEWLALKHEEKMLQARRRAVEDELLMHVAAVPEGTVHLNDRIKIQFKFLEVCKETDRDDVFYDDTWKYSDFCEHYLGIGFDKDECVNDFRVVYWFDS